MHQLRCEWCHNAQVISESQALMQKLTDTCYPCSNRSAIPEPIHTKHNMAMLVDQRGQRVTESTVRDIVSEILLYMRHFTVGNQRDIILWLMPTFQAKMGCQERQHKP